MYCFIYFLILCKMFYTHSTLLKIDRHLCSARIIIYVSRYLFSIRVHRLWIFKINIRLSQQCRFFDIKVKMYVTYIRKQIWKKQIHTNLWLACRYHFLLPLGSFSCCDVVSSELSWSPCALQFSSSMISCKKIYTTFDLYIIV